MANTPTQVATGSAITGAASVASGSITPASGKLYLASITFMRDVFANTVTPASGWTLADSYTDSGYVTLHLYRAMGQNLTSGAQTWTPTGGENIGFGAQVEIMEYPEPDTSGTNGSGAVPSTNIVHGGSGSGSTLTLTYPNAMGAGSGGYAAFCMRGGTATGTPRSGWTESSDTAVNVVVGAYETQWRITTDTVAAITWSSTQVLAGIAVEVKAAAAASLSIPVAMNHRRNQGFS